MKYNLLLHSHSIVTPEIVFVNSFTNISLRGKGFGTFSDFEGGKRQKPIFFQNIESGRCQRPASTEDCQRFCFYALPLMAAIGGIGMTGRS
ncbi:MAG: hypothetical protein ACLUHE_14365 [Christensenellales bacterium]